MSVTLFWHNSVYFAVMTSELFPGGLNRIECPTNAIHLFILGVVGWGQVAQYQWAVHSVQFLSYVTLHAFHPSVDKVSSMYHLCLHLYLLLWGFCLQNMLSGNNFFSQPVCCRAVNNYLVRLSLGNSCPPVSSTFTCMIHCAHATWLFCRCHLLPVSMLTFGSSEFVGSHVIVSLQGIIEAYKSGITLQGNTTSLGRWDFSGSFFFSISAITTIGKSSPLTGQPYRWERSRNEDMYYQILSSLMGLNIACLYHNTLQFVYVMQWVSTQQTSSRTKNALLLPLL